MKIKKLLSTSLLFFLPFFLILLILFCLNILIKDFNLGHKSHNAYPKAMNWVKYSFDLRKKKITNFIFKQYLKAEKLIKKKKQKVRMRYFGDNPNNWMFNQKAIRIKTKKSETINRRRYFDYRPSQNKVLDEYVAFKMAKKLNLLVPEVRLVELFINDKSSGIYMEKERLNESFLRRNKIMPINLYKGEASRNSEKKNWIRI